MVPCKAKGLPALVSLNSLILRSCEQGKLAEGFEEEWEKLVINVVRFNTMRLITMTFSYVKWEIRRPFEMRILWVYNVNPPNQYQTS